jgi:Anti-sigma-K factor rskA
VRKTGIPERGFRSRERAKDLKRDRFAVAMPVRPVPRSGEARRPYADRVASYGRRVEASSAAPVPTRSDALEPSPEGYEAAPANVRSGPQLAPVELPPSRGLSGATIAGLALVAGVAAIALGLWAFVTSVREEKPVFVPPTVPKTAAESTIALLSRPSTRRVPFEGSRGRIVLAVGGSGRAFLIVDRLPTTPAGKSYEAWVLRPRATVQVPAAVFSGRETVVPLSVPVRRGSILAITLERQGGAPAPTQTPLYVAQR